MVEKQQKNKKIPEGPSTNAKAISFLWAMKIKKTSPCPPSILKRKRIFKSTALCLLQAKDSHELLP